MPVMERPQGFFEQIDKSLIGLHAPTLFHKGRLLGKPLRPPFRGDKVGMREGDHVHENRGILLILVSGQVHCRRQISRIAEYLVATDILRMTCVSSGKEEKQSTEPRYSVMMHSLILEHHKDRK